MFENIKAGDPVAIINHLGCVQIANVKHVTNKQIHVQSVRYKDAIEKYSREDGHPIGKDNRNRHFFIVGVDDPRVVRSLATKFYCDFLGSLSLGISAGQSLTPDDVTKRLENLRHLVDEAIEDVKSLDQLVWLYR